MELEKEKIQLLQEMRATKGSRFNAAERLRKRDRTRTAITSFASVYVIVLTVLPLAFHLPDLAGNIVNVTIIIFQL